MKQMLFSALVIAGLGLASFTVFTDLPIGSGMPKAEVMVKDVSGKEIRLKDAAGVNGTLVMFTCNTCPYVVKNQQRTREICNYAIQNKIGVVLINSNEAQRGDDDSFDAMKAYAKEQQYKWYYVVDRNSEIADAFDAKRTPETFLFSKDGKLIYHGAIDDNPSDESNVSRSHLKEAIIESIKGKEVTVKTSRSVGCGIKRL